MRQCPKCGHIDPPYWKHVKFSYFIDSCSLENFKILHPRLAKRIKKEREVDDKLNVYHLDKKNRWVLRKAKVDYGDKSWTDKCEKHDPRLVEGKMKRLRDLEKYWNKFSPKQKKLLEK